MTQALAGIRVLDLEQRAGGAVLRLPARVCSARSHQGRSPEHGDLARKLGADASLNERLMGASFLAQNSGKKSVTVNLKSEGGKEVLQRLVRTAHVLVENFRPGVMDRLGVGLRAVAPAQSVARLLRDLGVRPGRADEGRAGVRPDHSGHVRRDEHHRRRALRPVARGLSRRGYARRDHRGICDRRAH